MKSIARRRLRVAAYVIVAGLAIIFGLLSVYVPLDDTMRGFFVNAATELASVVLLFGIFSYFLVDAERDIENRFEQLQALLDSPFRMFDTPDPEEAEFGFTHQLASARSLDLAGYSMAHLFASYKHQLASAIRRGLHVRVVLLDSGSLAGQLMAAHVGGDLEPVREPHERSLRYLREIADLLTEGTARGRLQVKCMEWVPSCYLNIVDADDQNGLALIGINALTFNRKTPRRIHFVLEKAKRRSEFGYFVSQFDHLWESIGRVTLAYPAGAS